MKNKHKKFEIIKITWLDSTHDDGWKRESEWKEEGLIEYETVGFYLGETKRTIKVVQSRCIGTDIIDDYLVDSMMQIPKVSIIKFVKL